MAPFVDRLGEGFFNSTAAIKRKVETGIQNLKEVVEDWQDDPVGTRSRLISQSQTKASELATSAVSNARRLKNDPLEKLSSLRLSPFASQSPSSPTGVQRWEQWQNQNDSSLPSMYRDNLESWEDSCSTCLRLASNERIPLSDLRSSAESGGCWVCEAFWRGLILNEAGIKEKAQDERAFKHQTFQVYVRLWRAFELVLQQESDSNDEEPLRLSALEFYTHGFQSLQQWPPFRERKHLPRDPCSSQCIDDIRRWIAECATDHLICRQSLSRRPPLPRRVVEIEDVTSKPPSLRLIETEGAKGPYVSLSHCWGNPAVQPLKTTRSNYETHRKGIPWARLSKTFQDSVTVTVGLGLRYLWIDSLCIIQDNKADWAAESSKMGSIYENAHIVIAASAASNGDDGCLGERYGYNKIAVDTSSNSNNPSGLNVPESVFTRYFEPDHASFVQKWEHPTYDPDLPLLSRAWAFQERVLATRVLHYTNFEMIWECKTRVDCECEQNGERNPGGLKHEFAHALRFGNALLLDRHAVWGAALEEYTSRDLTYAEDKLVALSATARRVAHFSLGPYLAGMWKYLLIDSLLWKRRSDKYPKARSRSYVAPTWSWASVEGQILDNPEKLPSRDLLFWVARRKVFPLDGVLDVQCQLGSDDPYGRVTGGHLKLSARVAGATFRMLDESETSHVIERQIEVLPTDQTTMEEKTDHPPRPTILKQTFIPDVDLRAGPDFLPNGSPLICLFLQAKESQKIYAIVLKPLEEEKVSFERIGLLLDLDEGWLIGHEVRTLTII